ncbi:MAG: TonB-dependent receptor [Saprospiraceae bacterium]|nr:TonB-dependent receptor [Saprospiraceae bacterium]MDZ4704238.1 TonB-dependent receptor [Saprospiraceae bacterium]
MKKIITALLLFLPVLFFAQNSSKGAFTGMVYDADKLFLPNATVQLQPGGIIQSASDKGSFYFENLTPGNYTAIFSFVGFATQEKNIRIRAGETTSLNVHLDLEAKTLGTVTVQGYAQRIPEISRLENVHSNYIISGKKNEVVDVAMLNANLAEKTGRQIFGKIPGAFVYDMDGSGNQVNVATRGLDPHRSWEFNVRQNGIMTNSDIYGYPASHYSPPMEAIRRIELVRGTGSLQYGAGFGGMVNYVTKTPDTTQTLSGELLTSVGSYGLFSSYLSAGGASGKWRYFGYYQNRVSDGYRDGARSGSDAQFLAVEYQASPTFNIRAEVGRSTYEFRVPGPLTDSMFYENPRQATRTRNYFSPDIVIPALTMNWQIAPKTKLSWVTSALLGDRSIVQFLGFANVVDAIDPATGAYKNRQVDIDNFHSYSTELKILQNWSLGRVQNTLSGGIRYINNDLHRRQIGKGTTGSDPDYSLIEGAVFGRDLHFKTSNFAVFAENLFQISEQFSVTAGFRYENGLTNMEGTISYLPANRVPLEIKHQFPLFGGTLQYQLSRDIRFYAGASQAYRPVIFADVIPPDALNRTDDNLLDATGWNLEGGMSGKLGSKLNFDLSYFRILYNDRVGVQAMEDPDGTAFFLKTNVGNTITDGVELYLEGRLFPDDAVANIGLFTASSWMNGRYVKGTVVVNGENVDLTGNKLESVPAWTSRNGLNVIWKGIMATVQYSYVDKSFANALNTVKPSANGAVGLVPSYGILDAYVSWRSGRYLVRFGVNNIGDKQYFTKRPTGYPGGGVWSSDGRSVTATVGIGF